MSPDDAHPVWPAELKARREKLGLSTRWLADRWQVRELTVQRWERNRSLPAQPAADMAALEVEFDEQARGLARSGHDVYIVPRTDQTSPDDKPAMWHRAVGITAALQTGSRLAFLPEE